MSGSLRIAIVAMLVGGGWGVSGCTEPSSGPSRVFVPPVPVPPAADSPPGIMVFYDPVTSKTSRDVRDASGHVVQFNTANELIWADGTRFPGFVRDGNFVLTDPSSPCWFEIRFGTSDGETRAYLTAVLGEEVQGSLVDLAVDRDRLVVRLTQMSPPGTYTLSGTVSEETPSGRVPLDGVDVWLTSTHVWQVARGTDSNGFYQMYGLYDGPAEIHVFRPGGPHLPARTLSVTISGNTRFDIVIKR